VLNAAVEFTWERPAKRTGFKWQERDGHPWLTRIEDARFKSYQPLEEKMCSGLFRTFANLKQTPEAILEFANRFGSLGGDFDVFRIFKQGIETMKALVRIWDANRTKDWRGLRAGLSVPIFIAPGIDRPDVNVKIAGTDELRNAGLRVLAAAIEPFMLRSMFGAWDKPRPALVWNSQKNTAALKLWPPTLLDALYVQFADAILGNKRHRQCQLCGRWFELLRQVNRVDRQTCSTSCRVEIYRQKKKRAAELHAKGWSITRIATEVGSDASTVKKWATQQE
jgi:hypothetical protein